MLPIPNCYERDCKHFIGVKWKGEEEATEVNYCAAYPSTSVTSTGSAQHLQL